MSAKPLYTVIVADDEDELREAVCTMIPWQELGFCLVGNASNGLDALQLVEKLEPDLLLTDIRMPFISGIELARQVREVRPATNIAFLSGHDDFEYAKQAIQYNIISYMLKPLTLEGLGEELRTIRQKIDAQFAMFRQSAPGPDRQDLRAEQIQQRHEEHRHRGQQRNELLACMAGVLFLPLPDVLSRDSRAAGRHGRENIDHQVADRIDQRYGADRSVTDSRHHQRVGKAHRDGQKLLEQQRPHQGNKLTVCK